MGEKQKALMGVVESLGTAKFDVPNVALSHIIERFGKDDSLVLMDTRSDEERSVSTIAGSITRADFESAPEKFSQKEIVCFCTVGYLSAATACMMDDFLFFSDIVLTLFVSILITGELRRKGFENVKNMGDGALLGFTLAQTEAGIQYPLVKPDGTATNDVHTFMPDLAPLAGEGMVAKTFADPGAVLTAANEKIKEILGL
jgi:hypothetical protein